MLIPGIALTLLGLYAVVFSKKISERARRDKWAFGGNRVFTLVAGLAILAYGALMLQSSIDLIANSERGSRSVSGWTWFWFIGGIMLFIGGMSQVIFSRRWSKSLTETRKRAGVPFLWATGRRAMIILGVVQAALGASWALGSWPF